MKRSVFCLVGPTASGKTQTAIELSLSYPFEIISVDSAMVYRDMDIGTSKPSPELLAQFPHRLINICDPSQPYSAAQFCQDVISEIETVFSKGKLPLLVGGTMLYFRAFQQGLASLPSADDTIRNQITEDAKARGWPELHCYLRSIDPEAAARIHPNDSQRIQRALEVYHVTGKPISQLQSEQWNGEKPSAQQNWTISTLGLIPTNRDNLHKGIAERFDTMLNQGLVDEVEKLFKRPDLTIDLPSIRSVGYRQVWSYLSGDRTYNEMREKSIIATRQLAKRQLTWLRSWPNLISIACDEPLLIEKVKTSIDQLLSL